MLEHQIEDLLLGAHEAEEDLIEIYFADRSSLDLITKRAKELLQTYEDPKTQEVIRKNLLECIVVKSQLESRSLIGLFRKYLGRMGMKLGKSREILRAEKLIEKDPQL